MANFLPPPGTSDIYPEEISSWYCLEDAARKIFPLYGFGELRTPIFEYTEIFKHGIGSETEIVQKEMYSFEDRGGRSLTLRPEGTAGIIRSLAGTDVIAGNEKRVFYIGPMFRGERPAAGRRRQFHQVGVENTGRTAPELDAECISMLLHYLEELKITGSRLLLNTRASREDRGAAEGILREHFAKNVERMCEDCRRRIGTNVWRILDCKRHECLEFINSAPDMIEHFGKESRNYFDRVCSCLSDIGVEYHIEPRLVRGLDYYAHTVFEVIHEGLGAQNAIAGGGRYEIFLPETKKPVIGIGFAAGMERLLMARNSLHISDSQPASPAVYLIGLGKDAIKANMPLAMALRKENISAIAEPEEKSLKASLRYANKIFAKFAVIRGEEELKKGTVICKKMSDGTQEEIPVDKLSSYLKQPSIK